jgi:hypothetical protein
MHRVRAVGMEKEEGVSASGLCVREGRPTRVV